MRRLVRTARDQCAIIRWKKSGKPAPPPHIIKIRNILRLAASQKLDILVETGTFHGDTVAATKKYFKCVYSIEVDELLHRNAIQRFACDTNVRLIHGDSAVVLPQLLPKISGKILFWLDGHYSGAGTGRAGSDTPIIAELDAIRAHCNGRPYAIIIDDAREFESNPSYPELRSFVSDIESIFRARPLVKDDAIIVIPAFHPTSDTESYGGHRC
jgi:hypothetical protein